MQDNRICSLNKVVECKIPPENLYIAPATILLYWKNYCTDLSATVFSVKVHVFRYICGVFSHNSYVHDQNSITYDMIVTPETCRHASKTKKKQTKNNNWWKFWCSHELHVKTESNCNDSQAFSSPTENTSGQIKHYTFETLIQRVILTFILRTKEVFNSDSKKLPCLSMEGCCETTTLDTFAYTWETPDNCVMTKNLTQDENLLHYPLTTDQKENQFFFLSEFNDTGKEGT